MKYLTILAGEADKAPLYDKPKASSKTKMYVIKGKKVIEKWLDGSALVKP